jgi:hypothetical protein
VWKAHIDGELAILISTCCGRPPDNALENTGCFPDAIQSASGKICRSFPIVRIGERNAAHLLVQELVLSAMADVKLRPECSVANELVSARPAASVGPPSNLFVRNCYAEISLSFHGRGWEFQRVIQNCRKFPATAAAQLRNFWGRPWGRPPPVLASLHLRIEFD